MDLVLSESRDPSGEVSWFSTFLNLHIYLLLSTKLVTIMCYSHRMFEKRHMPRNKTLFPHMLSHGGYDFLEKKLMEEKQTKWLEEAIQSESTKIIVDPPSPIRRHVKWKMVRTKKTNQMTSKVVKEITGRIVSHFYLSVVIFYNNFWMSKPILFHLLITGFLWGEGLTRQLCRPWISGCTHCCH